MNEFDLFSRFGKRPGPSARQDYSREAQVILFAQGLFRRAYRRGQIQRVWNRLMRRPSCLLDLNDLEQRCIKTASRSAGVRAVPVRKIRGSQDHPLDFTQEFYPLQRDSSERWKNIAWLYLRGAVLPPVDLIQVRDVYFVRDGHQRISVCRALGRQYIQASVTTWEVAGLLPWEERGAKPRGAYGRVRDESSTTLVTW